MKRLTERGLKGALFRYQLMANIVGVLIIPLFLFFFLHLACGELQGRARHLRRRPRLPLHRVPDRAGYLALKARLHIPWIVLMFAAGLVPGLTFLVEWLVVTRKIQPLLAAQGRGGSETGVSPAAR